MTEKSKCGGENEPKKPKTKELRSESTSNASGTGSAPDRTESIDAQLSAAKFPKEAQEFIESRQVAANFGNIVTVLMQSPDHKDRKLSELHELVVPALVSNQFRVAEAHKKGSGHTIPVAVILWARVSDEADQRLSDIDSGEVKLTSNEWVSGNQLWIMEVVGEQRFVAALLQDLQKKEFKNRKVKYRRKTNDGIEVASLDVHAKT